MTPDTRTAVVTDPGAERAFGNASHARRNIHGSGSRERILTVCQTAKPWIEAGLSERTYYRRQAEARALAPEPEPPQQHAAHAITWFSTLGVIAQLEHRSFVRRCIAAVRRP